MLANLRDGERDAVIAYHVDRLTRRLIELEQFLEALGAAKVRLVVGDTRSEHRRRGLLVQVEGSQSLIELKHERTHDL
jgi:DNA invertase Pin-like site-specific DNA recombinase